MTEGLTMRECSDCGGYPATNWLTTTLAAAAGQSYNYCDACYARRLDQEARREQSERIRAEQAQAQPSSRRCAICSDWITVGFPRAITNDDGRRVHYACHLRQTQGPPVAWSTYHDKPMSDLTPTERWWEQLYREDDLDRMAAG